jgi:hypothetical protein
MLVFDQDDALYFGRALPRDWLASGKQIVLRDAPTPWGRVSLHLQADPGKGTISGRVELPERAPSQVWLSLRVPAGKTLREVRVNGRLVSLSGSGRDRVALPVKGGGSVVVLARYV